MFQDERDLPQGKDKMIIPTMFPKRWGTISFERKGLNCSGSNFLNNFSKV
jgi:hypothetical protein